jgi:hypothetical protein
LDRAAVFVDPIENWTACSDEPKVFSQERVKGCHFCVLLVAFRRGYIPENETLSATQLEYRAAMAKGMDVLAYLLDEHAPWPVRFNELDRDPEIRTWRKHLEKRHGGELFGPDPRSIDIAPAITRWVVAHTHPVVASLDGLAGEFSDHEALLGSRKEDVISHLERARGLIRDVHAKFAQGRDPGGGCQQIFDTGALLVEAIGDALPPADLYRLQGLLEKA